MRLSIRTAAFSFVLSVMLWLYITLQAEYEVTVPVRLDVQLPPQRSLREPLPDRVYVKLRGSGWSLLNAMYLDRSARVVVSIPPHTQRGTIGESELRAGFRSSASVAVAIIEPTAIEYDLGTIVQKKVPLVPNVEYEPADGYVLARRLFVVPDSVVVIGSESVLDTVTHWTTRPLVRKQLRRTTVDVVEVVSSPIVRVLPEKILVKGIVQQVAEVTYYDVPVRIESALPSSVRVAPLMVTVTLRGGIEDIVRLLDRDEVPVSVSISREQLRRTGELIEPRVDAPPWAAAVIVEPRFLHYRTILDRPSERGAMSSDASP
ncbi:MAG: hypothetical protein N3B17_01980 [Chlorobi bacterium]|nr:hypothetical protein [Chlorobiota bacterium]